MTSLIQAGPHYLGLRQRWLRSGAACAPQWPKRS